MLLNIMLLFTYLKIVNFCLFAFFAICMLMVKTLWSTERRNWA